MEKPYATVIVTAYGRTKYVYEALQSVLSQTLDRKMYEIIVVTDFEMDPGFISKNNISAVRCERKELGTKIAIALDMARGDIMAILEDDDLWEANKLESIVDIFQSMPEVGFVHNWMRMIGAEGEDIQTSFQDHTTRKMKTAGPYLLDASKLTYGRARRGIAFAMDYYSSSISFRKSIIMGNLNALNEISTSTDVFCFYSCLMGGHHLLALPEMLTRYRIHATNLSLGTGDEQKFISRKREYALEVLKDYSKLRSLASISGKKVVVKLIDWRLSATKLETIWFSNKFSRLRLLHETLSYSRYLSAGQLKYDAKVIAYSFLLLVNSKLARNTYISKYYERH